MKRKNILFGACVALIIALEVTLLLVPIRSHLERAPIEAPIDPACPTIALTFDDGPNRIYTRQVLDILYAEQVPATFFLVGEKVSGNQNLILEMVASGHEIENHTFTHADLTTLNRQQIQDEIRQAEDALQTVLPDHHSQFVRPPYGRYTKNTEDAVDYPFMLWTIDSGDWEKATAEKIHHTVVCNIHDGDIIVFHDDNAETVKALSSIISELKDRGFQFATVSELLKRQLHITREVQ